MSAMRRSVALLYAHGFRSSPDSFKSRFIKSKTEDPTSRIYQFPFYSPQLPTSPIDAVAVLEAQVRKISEDHSGIPICLIGSSLGGFYSTLVVEKSSMRNVKAVLLNPAIYPSRDLADKVGLQSFWHDSSKEFEFTTKDLQELIELEKQLKGVVNKLYGTYALLACTGDEVINWKEMVTRYDGCVVKIVEGSDHGISDFERYYSFVEDFILFADT